MSVGPDIQKAPTSVLFPPLRRKVQHGSGVDMGDSNADTNVQDEDKMEESNVDHNQMHIPVFNVWDEPRRDEVQFFLDNC